MSSVANLLKPERNEPQATVLCHVCKTMFASDDFARRIVDGDTVEFYFPRLDLEEREWKGCELCRVWVAFVRKMKPDSSSEMQIGSKAEADVLKFMFKKDDEEGDLFQLVVEDGKGSRQVGFLEVSTNQGDEATKFIRGRSATTIINLPQISLWVQHWLEDCHANHEKCNENQLGLGKSDTLPSYLLDLGSGQDDIGLKNTALLSPRSRYAALSYCWGLPQHHATTTATLEAAKKGISMEKLPQTVRDAVTVTRALGLKFLWVDSVCIIQDSPSDMQHEIGLMGAIYHNAYVVISAASAKTCEDGFLKNRCRPTAYINAPFGDKGSIDFVPKLRRSTMNAFGRDPLSDRGWAYQESFMARRILVFSNHQVNWSCMVTGGDDLQKTSGYWATVQLDDSCRTDWEPEPRDWGFIIAIFCRRKLTHENDKLPALSSVSELFSRVYKTDYMAGIWAGVSQLLTWDIRPQDAETTRPRKWRAPSWSYMSLDGPVGFCDINGGKQSEGKYMTEFISFGWEGRNWIIKPLSVDAPYGEVVEARMDFGARLMEVMIDTNLDRPCRRFGIRPSKISEGHDWHPNIYKAQWTLVVDVMVPSLEAEPQLIASCYGPLPLTERIWCLLMWYSEMLPSFDQFLQPDRDYEEYVWGLALVKRIDGRYHRVGRILGQGEKNERLSEHLKKVAVEHFVFI